MVGIRREQDVVPVNFGCAMLDTHQRRQVQAIAIGITVIDQKIGNRQAQHRILAPGYPFSRDKRNVVDFRYRNTGCCLGHTALTILNPIGETGFAMEIGVRTEDHLATRNHSRATGDRGNRTQ